MVTVKIDIDYMKMLFGQCDDMVFYMRKDGQDYVYEYINPAAASTIPNIAIGKTVAEVMEPKLAKTILKFYNEAITTGMQTQFQDYTMFTNDIRKFESTVYPTMLDGGAYILSITRQITFDRNIEDKYLFMRSVFFKTFLSTVLISNKHELLEANPAFLNDFAIRMDDVRGKKLQDLGLIEPQFEEKYMTYIQESIAGNSVGSKHLQLMDRNGEMRHFIGSFSPLTDDSDEVIAVFLILQETTDFVKQKQELKAVSHTMDVLKNVLSSTGDMTISDVYGRIVDVNDKYLQRCGYEREELVGKTHRILNSGFHPKDFFQNLWQTIQSGQIWRGEICNRTKDGMLYWNEATILPLRDVHGEVYQYLGVYFNVSDKKKMMTELRMIERTFRLITENTNDLIVIVNEQGRITYASPSYIRLFGIEEDVLLGMCYEQLLTEASKSRWSTVIANDRSGQDMLELELLLPTGDTIWTECHYKTSLEARLHRHHETTMVSRIITERKNYEEQLVFMAFHDNLTQLPNRRYLEKEFPHLLEAANAQYKSIAIIYIDGDNFKCVNDRYGHDVGDDFIRNFGRILARNIKEEDVVVRMGGDEFVVVLTQLSRQPEQFKQEITAFFKQLQFDLSVGWVTNGISFTPTATMGVVMYPNDGVELDTLIDLADQMLYEAKAIQRNSFKIYSAAEKL